MKTTREGKHVVYTPDAADKMSLSAEERAALEATLQRISKLPPHEQAAQMTMLARTFPEECHTYEDVLRAIARRTGHQVKVEPNASTKQQTADERFRTLLAGQGSVTGEAAWSHLYVAADAKADAPKINADAPKISAEKTQKKVD